jgi:hypothetical protein
MKNKQLLIDCGRDMGNHWLNAAVSTATDNKMLENQIFTLRRAAIFMLTTEGYNSAKQNGLPFAQFLGTLAKDMANELSYLEDADMVLHTTDGNNQ